MKRGLRRGWILCSRYHEPSEGSIHLPPSSVPGIKQLAPSYSEMMEPIFLPQGGRPLITPEFLDQPQESQENDQDGGDE